MCLPAVFFSSHGGLSSGPSPCLSGSPLEARRCGQPLLGEGHECLSVLLFFTNHVPGYILFFQGRILLRCKAVVQVGCLRYSRPSLGDPQSILLGSLSPSLSNSGGPSRDWGGD